MRQRPGPTTHAACMHAEGAVSPEGPQSSPHSSTRDLSCTLPALCPAPPASSAEVQCRKSLIPEACCIEMVHAGAAAAVAARLSHTWPGPSKKRGAPQGAAWGCDGSSQDSYSDRHKRHCGCCLQPASVLLPGRLPGGQVALSAASGCLQKEGMTCWCLQPSPRRHRMQNCRP